MEEVSRLSGTEGVKWYNKKEIFTKMFYRIFPLLAIICISIAYSQEGSIDTSEIELYGAINITSTPSEAEIYLNGRKTDYKTPALLTKLRAGLNTIEVSLPDYLFAKRQVNIIPDSTISISFKLISLSS